MNDGANEQLNDIVEKNETRDDEPDKKITPLSSFIDYVEIFVVAICAVILLFSIAFRTCTVDGNSMNNTLLNGEVLLVSNLFYTPEREDIIVFHNNDGSLGTNLNKPLVKRVIGVEGDIVTVDHTNHVITITNKDGETFTLNGEYVFLDSNRGDPFFGEQQYVVPEGKLFVMGDNQRNSLDSRYPSVGFVDERSVLGKVFFRLTPLSKIGIVK